MEVRVNTSNGEVSILVLVTDEDISIFFDPDCEVIPVEGTDDDKDGVMVLRK